MKRLTALLALLSLPGAAAAQAGRCMPQEQAAAVVTFALPSLVTALAGRCGPSLGPDAYLSANATALADRFRPDAAAAWPAARRAIGGLFQQFLGQPMPEEMNSDLLRQLAEPMLGNLLAKRVSTDDCVSADGAVAAAALLPGRNIGRLAAIALILADRSDRGIGGVIHICRPAAGGRP